ncbi:MAG TPA: cytochrome P450 [Pseudonocardia sp.]|jgi:cytochrome P450
MTVESSAIGHHSARASGDPDRPYDDVDISSRDFWSGDMFDREKRFAQLRAKDSITWHPPFQDQLIDDPEDHGFWAVTKYDDVVEVSKRHQDFLSGEGVLMESLPPEFVEAVQSFIGMDPPRHTKLRRLVAAAFTYKQMRRIDEMVEQIAVSAVRNLLAKAEANGGQADFVAECAELVPMNSINDMMAVPEGKREEAARQAKISMSWNDPEIVGHTRDEVMASLIGANMYCHELATSLVAERRANPGEDLITSLAQAEIDGERLTDHEIGSFFTLLTVAGNDTTRQASSHALVALTAFPEQRRWLLEDLEGRMGTAIEELVRWATPIITFRRTASRDLEFRGRQITKGDKVVLFYSSANWDGTRIERPHELDLSRKPNPHLGFGGGGIHHCLGNQLARTQLRAIMTELFTRAPDIRAGDPELVTSNFLNSVKRLPCTPNP